MNTIQTISNTLIENIEKLFKVKFKRLYIKSKPVDGLGEYDVVENTIYLHPTVMRLFPTRIIIFIIAHEITHMVQMSLFSEEVVLEGWHGKTFKQIMNILGYASCATESISVANLKNKNTRMTYHDWVEHGGSKIPVCRFM